MNTAMRKRDAYFEVTKDEKVVTIQLKEEKPVEKLQISTLSSLSVGLWFKLKKGNKISMTFYDKLISLSLKDSQGKTIDSWQHKLP